MNPTTLQACWGSTLFFFFSFYQFLAVLLREEVAQLQEEVHLLRQMKDMLSKDLEESQGSCSADVLSATELRVQLAQKEQELDRAKEALQGGLVVCVNIFISGTNFLAA